MPRVQDALPSLDCRAWKGRSNPLLLSALRFAPEIQGAAMRGEQFVSTNRGKPAIAATARPGEFKGKGVIPAKAAGKATQAAPAPGGVTPPEAKEKPATVGQPAAPELPPSAPKPGEKPSAVEKLVKPEAAPSPPKPGGAPTAVEKLGKPEPAPKAPAA